MDGACRGYRVKFPVRLVHGRDPVRVDERAERSGDNAAIVEEDDFEY